MENSNRPKGGRITLRGVVHLIAFILLLGAMATLYFRLERAIKRLKSLDRDIAEIKRMTDETRRQALLANLADKVEEITAGADTDQERCLAIARWIPAHFSNRADPPGDNLGRYAKRSGVCGTRAAIFVQMAGMLNIPAHIFNIYELGHSCAQAYYDGGWHYFDLTWAGIFMRKGVVLSWEEIRSNPEDALKGMVVFGGLDRDGTAPPPPSRQPRLDNEKRMRSKYTIESIAAAGTFGKWFDEKPKILQLTLDCGELANAPFLLGGTDGKWDDIRADARAKKPDDMLFYYTRAVGTVDDHFHVRWLFRNAKPGDEYSIVLVMFKETREGMKFTADPQNCTIVSGGEYVTADKKADYPRKWEIRFKARASECSVLLKYDFSDSHQGLLLDRIEVSRR